MSFISSLLFKQEEDRFEKFQKAQYVHLRDKYGDGVDVHLVDKEMSFFIELIDTLLFYLRWFLVIITFGLFLVVTFLVYLIAEKLFGYSRDVKNYWLLIDHNKKTGTLLEMKRNKIKIIQEKDSYYVDVVDKENKYVYKGLRSYGVLHTGYERAYTTEYEKNTKR